MVSGLDVSPVQCNMVLHFVLSSAPMELNMPFVDTQHVRQWRVEVHKERLSRHVCRPWRISLQHLRRQDVQLPRRLHLRPLQGEAFVSRNSAL